MAKMPVNPIEVMNALKKTTAQSEQKIRVGILIDPLFDEDVATEIARLCVPEARNGHTTVDILDDSLNIRVDKSFDAVLIAVGQATSIYGKELVAHCHAIDVPACILTTSVQRTELASYYGLSILDAMTVTLDSAEEVLASWFADNARDKKVAFARCFPWLRQAIAKEYVSTTALQNAAVGGLLFIPGADMPVMTLNQAKMVVQIAACYGQPLSTERIKELLVVVGGGFAFRTVARQVVGLVPGFGWAIKATIGYSGTLAMGYGAIEYFERGGDMDGIVNQVASISERLRTKRAQRGARKAESIVVEPPKSLGE